MVKYKKEIDEILNNLCEDWMDEGEKKLFIELLFKELNINYEILSNQLETGIMNGINIDDQLKICKMIISNNKFLKDTK